MIKEDWESFIKLRAEVKKRIRAVDFLTSLGLPSISINSDTLKEDPELWNKVARGDYRMIYGTPESILKATSYFWKLLRKDRVCPFLADLVLVAVDECHCINEWHELRPEYQLIGSLREILATVPFIALSTTIITSSENFIIESAKFRNPFHIRQSIARPNITIIIYEIRFGFDQLNFMILNIIFLPHQIPLAMIFVDNINKNMEIIIHLQNRLPARLRPRKSELIRIYNADLDGLTRKTYLDDFRNGDMRILVGMDAMGMGIDIRQIESIVQWGLSPILNMSILYQRIGRAGREHTMSAYAKIFIQSRYLIENLSNS
jgi:superfamily II DNA helicase RecQ